MAALRTQLSWFLEVELARALRSPTAARNGPSAELLGFRISQVEFAHTLSRIGKGDANGRTLPFGDFGA
jgi:hypothetical protein